MSQDENNTKCELPEEMWLTIFRFLPPHTIGGMACVSKTLQSYVKQREAILLGVARQTPFEEISPEDKVNIYLLALRANDNGIASRFSCAFSSYLKEYSDLLHFEYLLKALTLHLRRPDRNTAFPLIYDNEIRKFYPSSVSAENSIALREIMAGTLPVPFPVASHQVLPLLEVWSFCVCQCVKGGSVGAATDIFNREILPLSTQQTKNILHDTWNRYLSFLFDFLKRSDVKHLTKSHKECVFEIFVCYLTCYHASFVSFKNEAEKEKCTFLAYVQDKLKAINENPSVITDAETGFSVTSDEICQYILAKAHKLSLTPMNNSCLSMSCTLL